MWKEKLTFLVYADKLNNEKGLNKHLNDTELYFVKSHTMFIRVKKGKSYGWLNEITVI